MQISKENGGCTVRCCHGSEAASTLTPAEPVTDAAPKAPVMSREIPQQQASAGTLAEKRPSQSRLAVPSATDEAIETGTWDMLSQMATELWNAASTYLSGDEKQDFIAQERKSIQRMNTMELRTHVKAARDQVEAQSALASTEGVDGKFIAAAQRGSMNVVSGTIKFDGDMFANAIAASLDEKTGQVNASKFLEAANAVPLLMGGLGRTFEFASSDFLKKLSTADTRMKETAKALGVPLQSVTLQQMVELDIQNGTTHAGKAKSPASRTILRLLWLFDFIGVLLQNLGKNPSKPLAEVCGQTYEDTLAPKHIWIIRKAARSGMGLLPAKSEFRKRLGTEKLPQEEENKKLLLWAAKCNRTSEVMWAYMKSKGLEELP